MVRGERRIIVRIKFFVALTEPRKFKRHGMLSFFPAEVEPKVNRIRAAAVAKGIVHIEHIGIIGIVLITVIAAVHPTTRVFEKRDALVAVSGIGVDGIEAYVKRPVFSRGNSLCVASEVAQDAASGVVSRFTHRAFDVIDVHLPVESAMLYGAES